MAIFSKTGTVHSGAVTGLYPSAGTYPDASLYPLSESGGGAVLRGVSATAVTAKTGTVTAIAWAAGTDVSTFTETGKVLAGARFTGFFRGAPGPTGKFVLTNARVVIGGVDVSRDTSAVVVELASEPIDVTPIGSTYREYMPGPPTGTFTFSFFADPVVLTKAFWDSLDESVSVEVTPRNLTTGPTNPTWTATACTFRKKSLAGRVGEAAVADVELKSIGEVVQVE